MNRKKYWIILLNPIFLILYGYGFSVVSDFCKYGNVSHRLPLIAKLFLTGFLWFILWTAIYLILKKKAERSTNSKKSRYLFVAELTILFLITGFYGLKIYEAAQPYNGKLGYYLNDLKTRKEVTLNDSERNFLENGLDGILEALSKHCGLDIDQPLYTANTLTIGVDQAGCIQTLDAFLYAFNEGGNLRTWLISFDASKSKKMSVSLGKNANTTYLEQEQMIPLLHMIDALRSSSLPASLGMSQNNSDFSEDQPLFFLKYSGYIQGGYDANWYLVEPKNVLSTEDGYYLTNYPAPLYGAVNEGFLLHIYQEERKLATIATDIGSSETISDIQKREQEAAEIEKAKELGTTTTSDNGTMTFYLNDTSSMSLIVIDAALGSRFYAFQNGSIYNEDPFSGRIGVAESVYFLDESVGFILLTIATQDDSCMFYTRDGGQTFTQILLPVSDGEKDMAGNAWEYTSKDLDYIFTPALGDDGCLYVAVSYDSTGKNYMSMIFRSEDQGQTWQYLEYHENL